MKDYAYPPHNNRAKRSNRLHQKTALALAIASTLTGVAQAQDSDSTSRNPEVIEVHSSGSPRDADSMKIPRPLLDTPQTINIVSSDLIEQQGATTLRDVLRNVSGISMQAGEGGTPAGDQMSIRGYSARTDIFVDNVRDFGGYTRDPFNLEQVEVVKGPSSDYSGRGSTGGSINLVSKSPQMNDFARTSVAAGTDSYGRTSLDANKVLSETNNIAGRLNLMYHNQDSSIRDHVTSERWGIAPSLALGVDSDTEVVFSLFHMKQDNLPDYGIPWVPEGNIPLAEYANQAPPVDYGNWYGLLTRDFEDISTTLATVQMNHRISDNFQLSNITRVGSTERDSMITAPRFISDDSTDIRRSDEKYRDDKDDVISNQTNFQLDLESGPKVQHRVLFGLELTREEETRNQQALTGEDSPATDLFNPTPNDPYLENYQPTGGANQSDADTVALYLSDSMEINEKWIINGGLRWDQFDLNYTPDGGETSSRTDRMLSYRAGVVYKPVEEGSIYFGYGTSFNPSAEGLSLSGGRRSPGIEDLDPEENETVELGVKWQFFNNQLMFSSAVFHTEKTNARTQDPDNPDDLLVLQGEQLVQGFELGLAGSVTDRLFVSAGYTYLDTEVEDSLDPAEIGNELPNSPENSFNLWATYDVSQTLQFGLGGSYLDDRYNNTSNTRFAPSYWLWEATATWLINDNFNIRLNMKNLTDEEYIDYVGGGHFIPGEGRMAFLNASYQF